MPQEKSKVEKQDSKQTVPIEGRIVHRLDDEIEGLKIFASRQALEKTCRKFFKRLPSSFSVEELNEALSVMEKAADVLGYKPQVLAKVATPKSAEDLSIENISFPQSGELRVELETEVEKFDKKGRGLGPSREFFDAGPADEKSWPAAEEGKTNNAPIAQEKIWGGPERRQQNEMPVRADEEETQGFLESVLKGSPLSSAEAVANVENFSEGAIITAVKDEVVCGGIKENPEDLTPAVEEDEKPEFIAGMIRQQEDVALTFLEKEIAAGIVNISDYPKLKIPSRLKGKHIRKLFVMPQGVTDFLAFKKCAQYLRCFGRREGELDFVWDSIVSRRDASQGAYVWWADRRPNSDFGLAGKSPMRLRAEGVPNFSLGERCWHDLSLLFECLQALNISIEDYDAKMFSKITATEKGKSFFFDDSTICADSRVNDPAKHKDNAIAFVRHKTLLYLRVWEPKELTPQQQAILQQMPPSERREAEEKLFQHLRAHEIAAEFAPLNPKFMDSTSDPVL